MSTNKCPDTGGTLDKFTCWVIACPYCQNIEIGKWSASDNKCVRCIFRKADYYITGTTGGLGCWGCGIVHNDFNPDRCESACGANPCCDDVVPGTYVNKDDCKGYCDSDCNYIPWSISISASSYNAFSGETVTITAVTNLDLPLGYYIRIYEGNNLIKTCDSGSPCSVSVSKSGGEYNYYAKVVYALYKYNQEIVTSNTITVRWYNISLLANPSIQKIGNSITIIATSSVDVKYTPYYISIYEGSNRLASCKTGNSCSTIVTKTSIGTYTFTAKIENSDGSDVKAYASTTVLFVQCLSDSDCSGYDPSRRLKYYCECPSGCNIIGPSYTCKTKGYCSSNSECEEGYCCTADPSGPNIIPGTCNSTRTIINNQKSYLCVP